MISTNCMIARRSSSPSFWAMRCSSGLNCRSTATPPPMAMATGIGPITTSAPTAYISSMATSVVVPGCGSGSAAAADGPRTITATIANSPAATIQLS